MFRTFCNVTAVTSSIIFASHITECLLVTVIILKTVKDDARGGDTGSLKETDKVYHKCAEQLLLQ